MIELLSLSPLLPWALMIAVLLPMALFVLIALVTRRRGAWLRLLVFFAFMLALFNPVLIHEEREKLPNSVAIVVDESQSQLMGQRLQDSTAAFDALESVFKRYPDFDIRVIKVPAEQQDTPATKLFSALRDGISDIAPNRLSGVILLTDGQVHDIVQNAPDLGFQAPVNALISGSADEFDRKIRFQTPPRFGLIRKPLSLSIMVEDQGKMPAQDQDVPVDVLLNGENVGHYRLSPNVSEQITLTLTQSGDNIIELKTPTIAGELTGMNNHAVINVEGIRENLRVLLVSGEPHNGVRTWRDLLKSDTSVDLIHFTILRPPEKADNTPLDQLSLIVFPTTELFVDKINEFDLVIFDRYQHYNVLPLLYYDYMAQYVKNGGALLMATGPEYAGNASLARTPLLSILPALPTGDVIEKPFRPTLSEAGKRHPVTRDLATEDSAKEWGRWLRQIAIREPSNATVLMQGADNQPLMLLSHVDKGRVGMLLSDEGWLWARGFEGGGPYAALYRRMAHWLMKEPSLEEEALTAKGNGDTLFIRRQTMADDVAPATITTPSGKKLDLKLEKQQDGVFTARFQSHETGLFHVQNGELATLAHVGAVNAPEYEDMISTPTKLAPIARESGGNILRLRQTANDAITIPNLYIGDYNQRPDQLILKPATATRLVSADLTPLFHGFWAFLMLTCLLGVMWYREGR